MPTDRPKRRRTPAAIARTGRLKEAATEAGVPTAVALATLIDVPESTTRSYLNGARQMSRDATDKIGPLLGVNPEWLYRGEGSKKMDATNIPQSARRQAQIDWEILLFAIDEVCRQLGEPQRSSAEIAESVVQLSYERRQPPDGISKEAFVRRTVRWDIREIRRESEDKPE